MQILLTLVAWLVPSAAIAESCRVENASAPGLWKFVRVYDVKTGHLVLGQAVNGGDSKPVTVTGSSVRVEYKLAGHLHYTSGVTASCKGGNTVRT